MITVICPRCGRPVHAREKYVESSGGIPCLKCKVRISISKEQMGAYTVTEDGNPGSGSVIPPATAESLPESVKAETAALPYPLSERIPRLEPSAQEADAPLTGTDTAAPAITVEAASMLAVKSPDSDTPFKPMTAVFQNEAWEGAAPVAPEKETETMRVLRRELAEAKEYAVAAEEILTRLSQEKVATELGLLRKNRDAETRCRESTEKVKAREDEILGLRNTVHALEAQMGELTSALSSKAEECRAIGSSKDAESAHLSEKIQTMEMQAGELNSALAAKAEECRAIGETKGKESAVLSERIETLERQAADLNFLVAARTGEFRGVLERKEKEVESLRDTIRVLEKQAGELTAAVHAKAGEIQDLRASKETEEDALLKQILDMESKHEALMSSMKAEEESLQTALSRKDEEVQSLLGKVREREEQAVKMAALVKGWEDRMREVTEKESHLKALFDLLELDLKKETEAHQKLLASLRHQLQAA